MKQEPITVPPTIEQYIDGGLKKTASAVMTLLNIDNEKNIPKLFDIHVRYKHYLALANNGKITKIFENALVNRYFFRHKEVDGTWDSFKRAMGINTSLALLLELAGYYGAMASVFHNGKNVQQSTHYLIKAGEIHGMLYRLVPEQLTSNRVATEEHIKSTFEAFAMRDEVHKDRISLNAKHRAKKRHAVDPKTKEKCFIKDCWFDWQKNPGAYKNLSEFSRDMSDKCEYLKCNRDTIDRWIKKEWRAEYDLAC